MSRPDRNEIRRLRREQRKQERLQQERDMKSREKRNKMLTYMLIISLVSFMGYSVFNLTVSPITGNVASDNTGIIPSGDVHWHATPRIFLCGEEKKIYAPVTGHAGTSLLHTHSDRRIHVEGVIPSSEHITIGRFFDNIFVKFSETEIMNYKNGDVCPDGNPGYVKMFVNEAENNEFRNYVVRDGDVIEIRFE
jgi:hypothetical protein